MKKGDCIFVYGTLRRGERADLAKQAHAFGVDFLSVDKINGGLYHLGSFPGVKLLDYVDDPDGRPLFYSGNPTVTGEVFRVRDVSIGAMLDAYEGYIPPEDRTSGHQGLYDRCIVETEKGRAVWVYTYNHPVIEEQRIESGDWCKNKDMPFARRQLTR